MFDQELDFGISDNIEFKKSHKLPSYEINRSSIQSFYGSTTASTNSRGSRRIGNLRQAVREKAELLYVSSISSNELKVDKTP
jgi:hypothetical protein